MTCATCATCATSVTSSIRVRCSAADMGALRVLVAVAVALSTVVVVVVREAESSCVQARLCCQGKDTSCFAKVENGTCFCDVGCLDIGDCCTDYKDQCRRECYATFYLCCR